MRPTRAKPACRRLAPLECTTLADVLYVVAVCLPEAKDLAMLESCNKSCASAIQQFITKNVSELLANTIRTIMLKMSESYHEKRKEFQTIRWLIKTVGAVDPVAVDRTLNIPFMTDDLITLLLSHGLCPTYEQIVEAAKRRVCGVENWVRLMVRDRLDQSIPEGVAVMLSQVSAPLAVQVYLLLYVAPTPNMQFAS